MHYRREELSGPEDGDDSACPRKNVHEVSRDERVGAPCDGDFEERRIVRIRKAMPEEHRHDGDRFGLDVVQQRFDAFRIEGEPGPRQDLAVLDQDAAAIMST